MKIIRAPLYALKFMSNISAAVEKAVSELPAKCVHCNLNFPRNMLENHEAKLCPERQVFS